MAYAICECSCEIQSNHNGLLNVYFDTGPEGPLLFRLYFYPTILNDCSTDALKAMPAHMNWLLYELLSQEARSQACDSHPKISKPDALTQHKNCTHCC